MLNAQMNQAHPHFRKRGFKVWYRKNAIAKWLDAWEETNPRLSEQYPSNKRIWGCNNGSRQGLGLFTSGLIKWLLSWSDRATVKARQKIQGKALLPKLMPTKSNKKIYRGTHVMASLHKGKTLSRKLFVHSWFTFANNHLSHFCNVVNIGMIKVLKKERKTWYRKITLKILILFENHLALQAA